MIELPTSYQSFIHKSRYARWNDVEGRRESWDETVSRYCNFFRDRFKSDFPYDRVYSAILNLEVMPSMRCLMTAGPALARDEIAGYNCSYIPIDHQEPLMRSCTFSCVAQELGSVGTHSVGKLPQVADEFHVTDTTHCRT
jgi:ribonucleoside-triphosphate reductase